MIIKTFDEITEHMEDSFDAFIADKTDGVKIKRTNNNVVHNVLKADGKGYELVQASCVALDSKFDPARCSESDLVSVAKIAGTAMKEGKQTVLIITAKNTSSQEQDILASVTSYPVTLRFQYSADVWFDFTIPTAKTFKPGAKQEYFAWSVDPNSTQEDGSQTPLIGAYPVTAMSNIPVGSATDGAVISSGFAFSCASTQGTLGYPPETVLEFRKRILEDTDRQNMLKELELELNNLPTILSAKVTFNPSISDTKVVGPASIPPFQMLLSVNGEVLEDLGNTVLTKTYIPTVQVGAPYGDYLIVPSDNYTDGFVRLNYMRFRPYEYMIEITYTSDPTLALDDMIRNSVVATMKGLYGNPSRYTQELTEDMFYDTAKGLDIDSLKVLNVNLLEHDSGTWSEPAEGYIAVPASDLARMCGIKFINGESAETVVMFYKTANPVISISGTTCTITGEEGSTIYYTTDGTDPDDQSTEYTEPITVTGGDTVKAIAYSPFRSGPSDVVEVTA